MTSVPDASIDVKRVGNADHPLVDFLNVRFLLTEPGARLSPKWKRLYAGRDGELYLDRARFAAAGIAVETQRYEHPVYAQDYGEFAPFLSALDLLLMHGDEALGILCGGSTWSRLSPEPD